MKWFVFLLLTACSVAPPKNVDNVCLVFKRKPDWHEAAIKTQQRWGIPVAVQMAIMHQESHFVSDAHPPFEWFLFIPLGRASSAYGYAQALDETWSDYTSKTGNWFASRDDFADASDFVGWYTHNSCQRFHLSPLDSKNLYLAYHEGQSGYQRRTFLKKPWLLKVSDKVANRTKQFQSQLEQCQL